jgi:ribonuclease P protein component
MLKRVNRLRSQRDFKRTLAGHRLGANACFAVYALPLKSPVANIASNGPGYEPKLGFVISKKVHKRAVQRNRIKRRFREILRRWLLSGSRSALVPYRSIVVIARSGCLTASYQELERRMETCFRVRGSGSC